MHFLHLEDSAHDAELTERLVCKEWPQCKLERVVNRSEYEAALVRGAFDLILSDYTLPDFDGLSALELATRHCPDKPFIFLSGTIGEERAIEALQRGATDYVLKERPNRIVSAIRHALAHHDEGVKRRQTEDRLREQAALLDLARDAIFVTDFDHKITYWNASAERLFGWRSVEALGQDLRVLLFVRSATAYAEAGNRLRASREWRGELSAQARSGNTVIVESRWTLVAPTDQAPGHILLINTDITEKRKLETQFLRAQRIDGIAALAGGIAHDLNNVLSPILLAVGLLRNDPGSPSARALLDTIEAGAQHGAALIKQLLAFAHGTDSVHVELEPRQLIANLSQILQPILSRKFQIAIHCDEGLRRVVGDATQLNQVLINLCINARDAMPQGGRIDVSAYNFLADEAFARLLPDGKPGSYVCISVADTGTGIPPDILEKIFEPFFTTKEMGQGTGLGLSIVHGIMKNHGGCVQVESEVGKGSTFRLFLPAQPEPARPVGGSSTTPLSRLTNDVILVIDDEIAVRNVLRLLLERAGYRVISAADGAEGFAEFQRRRAEISLVITDMMMPVMNGPQVIEALRKISPGLRIIAMSGMMDASQLNFSRIAGPPIEYLAKPLTSLELLAAIDRTMAVTA